MSTQAPAVLAAPTAETADQIAAAALDHSLMALAAQSGHDIDVAIRTLDGEADGEPTEGQLAVAYVFVTRAKIAARYNFIHGHAHPLYGTGSLASACLQDQQFSCWLPGTDQKRISAMAKDSDDYRKLGLRVNAAIVGSILNPAPGATHYEVTGTGAFWDKGHTPVAVIGHHSFYCLPNG